MKYLLLIAGMLASGFAFGQQDEVYYLQKQVLKKQQKNTPALHKYQPPVSFSLPKSNSVSQQNEDYHLPDGNKVITLAQDKMPCIQPDMSQFNMPCVKPETKNYNMPIVGNNNMEEIKIEKIE